MAKTIEFNEWCPDITDLGTGVSPLISGAIPRADGYGPFKSLAEFTDALPAGCRAAFFARRSDSSIAIFAGTVNELYLLDNSTLAWVNVSKGGGPYGSLTTDNNWDFAQFNDLVLATGNTVPQKYILSSSTDFEDLGGSPPQASHVAIINRFVVLTGLLSNPRRVQWSDLDGPEVWTAGVGLSDYQDLPDGGTVRGISGGDAFGLVFQDEPIRSLVYNPGSATTFQITKIAENDPIFAQYSIVQAGDRVFYCSAQGFKMVVGAGGSPKPIGKERVDRYFFGDVDRSALRLMSGAADPTSTRVYWPYKSQAGLAGLFDKVLCFDWSIGENGRWSLLPISGEFLLALARPGLTLEQLDAIAPTQLSVTGAANNGAGLIRLTLSALSNADFDIHGQNFIVVQGVVGTTEANGAWPFTIIDATHIDLVGSTFVSAYVSGGKIGGSLDALPFSLDDVSVSAISSLAAFSSLHAAGFFTGPNIEAIMETPEADLEGRTVFISGVRPMTDAADAVVSVAGRFRQVDASVYTAETAIGDYDGICPLELETRYARGRVRVPAEAIWTYCRGVAPDAQLAGDT